MSAAKPLILILLIIATAGCSIRPVAISSASKTLYLGVFNYESRLDGDCSFVDISGVGVWGGVYSLGLGFHEEKSLAVSKLSDAYCKGKDIQLFVGEKADLEAKNL